jgi:HlyD family secretion protein
MTKSRFMSSFAPALMAAATLMLAACGGDAPAAGGPAAGGPGGFRAGRGGGAANIPAVEVVRAVVGTLPLEERVTGSVIARNQTEIYPEAGGLIAEIFVQNGDVVKKGDPLLRLRDAEFNERYQQARSGLEIAQAQTQQARANLELVQSQLNRTESLVARNLENNVNLETARSQLSIAQADLDLRLAQENQARSLLEERLLQVQNATIRAPIDGTVGQRNAEVGQLASASTRLFIIGELSEMRIELLLSDRMLEYIDEGVPVNIYSSSWGDKVLQSSISRISPFLDTTTLRTQAFVELGNEQNLLRPGMFVTVDILYGQSAESVLVPNSALYRHPRTGIEGVYVVSASPDENATPGANQQRDEGEGIVAPPQPVNFMPVEITASGRMSSAVRGINEGDLVVTVGQNLLQAGATQVKPRVLPWDSMMDLQEMQNEDMFDIIDQARTKATGKS